MSAPLSRYRERIQKLGLAGGLGPVGKYNIYSNGVLQSSTNRMLTGSSSSIRFERTWDQNNRGVGEDRRRGSRVFRTGGPFISVKVESPGQVLTGHGTYSATYGNTRYEYVGGFCNPYEGFDTQAFPPQIFVTGGGNKISGNPVITNTADLESRAFDIKPKIEKFSLVNALYEFKDVPGQLRQTARFFRDHYRDTVGSSFANRNALMPDRVASDYLNVQFGWVPFCRDIAAMADFAIFSKQYLEDISRGNNTWIKRKGTLVDVETTTKLGRIYAFGCEPSGSDMNFICQLMNVDGNLCTGYADFYAISKTFAWAEGAFKYYRPEFDVSLPYYGTTVASVNRYLTATGLRLSPSHVWKAIPWSWCVDWFSNVGSLIERHDAMTIDGMVTKYLYLMHHKKTQLKSVHRLNFVSGATTLEFTKYVDTKLRRSADSPYGFVLGGDLSATQWSILGALGLSRNVSFTRSF